MDAKQILSQILLATKFYQECLDQLANEIATGSHKPRDFTMTGIFSQPAHFLRYLEASRTGKVDFSDQNTSVAKIERRWSELGLDTRRSELLARVSSEEIEHRLLVEVTLQAKAYCSKVKRILDASQEMGADEFEEFQQDDELSDLETLTLRDTVDLLLPLIPESEEKLQLQEEIADADHLLRLNGAVLFGPLLRIGSIQQLRAARFEPWERWWWYLEQIGPAETS